MDGEKIELPKEALESISTARNEFVKLYANMNAEQIAKIMEPIREFTKIINTPLNMNITEAASSMAKELVNIKKVIPASYSFNSLNSLSTAMRDFLNSYQTTIFNDISAISEVLKSLSDHYSEEEIADIKSKLEILATKGLKIANAIRGIVVINPATVLFISNKFLRGPIIAPTEVIGVLSIIPNKIIPNNIITLFVCFVIIIPFFIFYKCFPQKEM